MSRARRLIALPGLLLLAACGVHTRQDSIAQLRDARVDLTDVKVEDGLDKAMQSYQRFLEQGKEDSMTPEAIRRLADLKLQKEYGTVDGVSRNNALAAQDVGGATTTLPAPTVKAPLAVALASTSENEERKTDGAKRAPLAKGKAQDARQGKAGARGRGALPAPESDTAFEARATQVGPRSAGAPAQAAPLPDGSRTDELKGGAGEAIQLYKKLLAKYPNYARNDQVLYQLSRAYDELGMTEDAMKVMGQIARDYPHSRYLDEVQFRMGENHFVRKKFLDAEDAYKSVVQIGPGSSYYELAVYKLGWTFYKQELYEDSLHRFVALLDHKVKTGYDFERPKDALEHKRVEDTYQVISLAFSNLGGSEAVVSYFNKHGRRGYEVDVYGNLGEYYLEKRRYSDAAAAYKAFVKHNPYHRIAPHYDTRVIEIYKKGGFPKLVIDANKEYVVSYGLKSPYWSHHDIKAFPAVVGYVKNSLKELANHYHALYQDKKFEKDKPRNFEEAMRWYRDYLASFPKETESPAINYQMAELLLENKNLAEAASEFERTAYDYPSHEKAADAGYTAVYAHRLNLGQTSGAAREKTLQETIRASLKFSETFPKHEKAALVMSAALEDIYAMKDYRKAAATSRRLIALFPQADKAIVRGAWLALAHSSFELENYPDAEESYVQVLSMTPESDKARKDLVENLAASIYKQGELANKQGDYRTAANHFLRVAKAAPTSSIKSTADFDGAVALIQLKDWSLAAQVLQSFRANYAGHKLQPEVTKKLAFVYREDGKPALAAAEYERIETETKDPEVRSAALQMAGDLYAEAKDKDKALAVYRRYLGYFPKPLDLALESRFKIAKILKERNDSNAYQAELKLIINSDAAGGAERTARTRYLGASSLLILTEPVFEQYAAIKLVKPFEQNLAKKKAALKQVKDGMDKILAYEIAETTAGASYYLAEMYYEFNRALVESERPTDLEGEEKEQYELALEDQAFPFEERAIEVHKKNTDFVTLGIYNSWVAKSYARLAKLVPARYAKFDESSGYVASFDRMAAYAELAEPMPPIVEFPKPVSAQTAPAADAPNSATAEPQDPTPATAAPTGNAAAQAEAPTAPAPAAPPAATAPAPTRAPAQKSAAAPNAKPNKVQRK